MEKKLKRMYVVGAALGLAACENLPPANSAPQAVASDGHAFAQASCGGCHAVGLYGTSSNPNAPPFGYIANQEGLTSETLSYWLRSAHNYPREMDFSLSDREVDRLLAYLLSLRDPNYRRPPDF